MNLPSNCPPFSGISHLCFKAPTFKNPPFQGFLSLVGFTLLSFINFINTGAISTRQTRLHNGNLNILAKTRSGVPRLFRPWSPLNVQCVIFSFVLSFASVVSSPWLPVLHGLPPDPQSSPASSAMWLRWLGHIHPAYCDRPLISRATVVDLQSIYPAHLVPSFMVSIKEFYITTYKDQFFISTPPFFKLFTWLELVYQAPVLIWAIPNLYRGMSRLRYRLHEPWSGVC